MLQALHGLLGLNTKDTQVYPILQSFERRLGEKTDDELLGAHLPALMGDRRAGGAD